MHSETRRFAALFAQQTVCAIDIAQTSKYPAGVNGAEIKRFYRTLGQAVRRARKREKLTQATLGDAIGLSRTSITNLERGRQHIPVHLLLAIARTLNVDSAELLPSATDLDLAAKFESAVGKNDPDLSEWLRSIVRNEAA